MTMHYPFSVFGGEFSGKRVLVAGGAKGIGEAIARRFQLSGAAVATTAPPAPQEQSSILFIRADIGTAAGAQEVVDRIQREWGGLDILVNNVGGTPPARSGFEASSDEDSRKALKVDLIAAVRLDLAFAPGMIERRSGVVIHMASIADRPPFAEARLAHAAAAGALGAYSEGLAKGLAPLGVRVNMISSRFIETSGAHGMTMDIARGAGVSEEAARRPEEVAELVSFLASDRAAFMGGGDYALGGGGMPTV
jgi:NAD(P)-dependent dehydrogenase (short-subunit alcohol dehydrogenase family)